MLKLSISPQNMAFHTWNTVLLLDQKAFHLGSQRKVMIILSIYLFFPSIYTDFCLLVGLRKMKVFFFIKENMQDQIKQQRVMNGNAYPVLRS